MVLPGKASPVASWPVANRCGPGLRCGCARDPCATTGPRISWGGHEGIGGTGNPSQLSDCGIRAGGDRPAAASRSSTPSDGDRGAMRDGDRWFPDRFGSSRVLEPGARENAGNARTRRYCRHGRATVLRGETAVAARAALAAIMAEIDRVPEAGRCPADVGLFWAYGGCP